MYTLQFRKWGWKKYRNDRGTKACTRSRQEISRVKSNPTSWVDESTSTATWELEPFETRLFIRPVDDEFTQHKCRIAQDMSSLIWTWADDFGYGAEEFRISYRRQMGNFVELYDKFAYILDRSPVPERLLLYLDDVFD